MSNRGDKSSFFFKQGKAARAYTWKLGDALHRRVSRWVESKQYQRSAPLRLTYGPLLVLVAGALFSSSHWFI